MGAGPNDIVNRVPLDATQKESGVLAHGGQTEIETRI